ncbi:MAG TPA: hypothetical protein PKA64_09940, partial [Myxococcota bacterium]|nr:hypothetical protein [Myxococcota bacterium]
VGWVRVPHAYAVLAADLRTPDGQPWSPGLPGPDRRASTVWVRDPYGDAEGREGELRLPLAVVDELFDTLSTHAVAP